MTDQAYPHTRNDCDSCRAFDADMAVHYDQTGHGRDVRWCQRCAGSLLARLALTGHTATVRPLDDPAAGDTTAPPPAAGNEGGTDNGQDAAHAQGVTWTVDLAEKVLRQALPSGSVFLRALVDEGGTATAERLKELTGTDALHYMTLTLNGATKKLTGNRRLRLAQPRHNPQNPRKEAVYEYVLPVDLLPVFDEALRRLGR
jgi:hypothetical protein